MIKSERFCMIMKMIQSREVKYAKSTNKENTTSAITPYPLVREIQRIEEDLWECNKKCKTYSLAGLRDRMCLLMTKCGILRVGSLFWCELSDFWYFMTTDEEPHPLHYVVTEIFRGKLILTGHYMEGSAVVWI